MGVYVVTSFKKRPYIGLLGGHFVALIVAFSVTLGCQQTGTSGKSEVRGVVGRMFEPVPRAVRKSDDALRSISREIGKSSASVKGVAGIENTKGLLHKSLSTAIIKADGLPRSQLKNVLEDLLKSNDGCDGIPCGRIFGIKPTQVGSFLNEFRSAIARSENLSRPEHKYVKRTLLSSLVDDQIPSADIYADGVVKRDLDPNLFPSTKKLVDRVFKEEAGEDLGAAEEIKQALEGLEYTEKETKRTVTNSRYWVAVDENTEDVGGIVGLYRYKDDQQAEWLNWFAVDPSFRGIGLGGKLLDSAIAEAKKTGRPYLRLFTDDEPYEVAAQKLYESRGLVEVGREKHQNSEYHRIFRELKLH